MYVFSCFIFGGALSMSEEKGKYADSNRHFCRWCHDEDGNPDTSFSIIDDDFAQFVPDFLVKYCPFCGRAIRGDEGIEPNYC